MIFVEGCYTPVKQAGGCRLCFYCVLLCVVTPVYTHQGVVSQLPEVSDYEPVTARMGTYTLSWFACSVFSPVSDFPSLLQSTQLTG